MEPPLLRGRKQRPMGIAIIRLIANAKPFVLALLLGWSGTLAAQYATGDYVSWQTGPWNTLATWRVYNGVSLATSPAPTAAQGAPNADDNVWIRNGTTVTATFGTVYQCLNLTVEAGGKLFNNDTGPTNLSYVSIFGTTLRCDGTIGNSPTLDGISFNVEGTNVLLSGTGQFEAARIRKNFNANPVLGTTLTTTHLTIDMDIALRFSGGSNTMIYNNFNGATTFNVTINAGRTVNLSGVVGAGNIAIDGVDGRGSGNRGGTFTVNGSLIIPGTLYLTTDNSSTAFNVAFVIGATGYVRTNLINSDLAGTGGTPSTHTLTMNAGGVLEVTGAPIAWSVWNNNANNLFNLNAASRFIYSGAGAQDVRPVPGGYGHLRIAGTGTKSLSGVTAVKGDLDITNSGGTPVLDVTASGFQLSVAGNWTNYATSGFNEGPATAWVQLNGTTSTQSVTTPGGEDFSNLRIVKSGAFPTVLLQSEARVAGILQLNNAGILDLNAQRLVLLNPAAGAIATSTTFGTLRHIRSERTDNASRVRWDIGTTLGAHVVPFGAATAYTPFTFNLVSGNAGQVTMATYGTPPDNLPWPTTPTLVTNLQSSTGLLPDNRDATVDRFWQVDVTGAPLAHLTFSYAASELPTLAPWNDAFSMRAQRWNSAVPMWEDQLESGGSVPYAATANNVTAFGPFTLTPVVSPLPIELLSFTAQPVNDAVKLEWITASESGNAAFTILRSGDGQTFTEVLRMPGAGHSLGERRYATVDESPLPGLSYYRLKQTDFDGRSTLSGIVAVEFRSAAPFTVHPNPASDWIRIGSSAAEGGALRVQLLDAAGRTVLDERVPEGGMLPVGHLPRGAYLLRSADGGFAPQRLLLQ